MVVQAKRVNPSNEKPKYKTLLVDGHNLFIRSSVSCQTQVTQDGFAYGTMWQFLLTLKILIKNSYDYDYIYVFFDGEHSGQMRYDIYNAYKGNREDKNFIGKDLRDYKNTEYARQGDEAVRNMISFFIKKKGFNRHMSDKENEHKQLEILKELLNNLCIRVISFPFVESDDLIAYYVNHKESNEQIVIVSNDKDIAQLITEDVAVYSYEKKKYITTKNYKDFFDIHYSNIVVEKIICGDKSDNIKGIKGVAIKTLTDLMPQMVTQKVTLNEIRDKARTVNEERVKNNQKPLIKYTNLAEGISDGEQGNKVYEINEKLVDLSLECMIPQEVKEEFDAWLHAPMEITNENPNNNYNIIQHFKLFCDSWGTPNQFGAFFSTFHHIYNKEVKRYKDYVATSGDTNTIIQKANDVPFEDVPF